MQANTTMWGAEIAQTVMQANTTTLWAQLAAKIVVKARLH
jgi:hypothetical protein